MGEPVTALAGLHPGCFELFATERIRRVTDLKGRSVGVSAPSSHHLFLASIAAYVGLDPARDIDWSPVPRPSQSAVRRRQDRRLPRLPPSRRTCAPGMSVTSSSAYPRPAVVAIFLLPARGQPPLPSPRPDCYQAHGAGGAQVRRPLRHRAGSGRSAARRRGLRHATTTRSRRSMRSPTPSSGNTTPRLDPLLRAAPARGGYHHVEPHHDHRRRHRLAFPRRGQARAEGVTAARSAPRRCR